MELSKNDLIYTTTQGEVKNVDARTGKKKWSYKTNGKIYSTPKVCDKIVLVSSTDKKLYGLEIKNGKLKFSLPNERHWVASPACDKNVGKAPGTMSNAQPWIAKNGHKCGVDEIQNFTLTRPIGKRRRSLLWKLGNEFYALNTATVIWNGSGIMDKQRMFSPAQESP